MSIDPVTFALATRLNNRVLGTDDDPSALSTAEWDMLDLLNQSAWAAKDKFWFDARCSVLGDDGYVQSVRGMVNGPDGQPQYLERHPAAAAAAQRVGAALEDGVVGWGNQFPLTTGAPFGTLLSSANAKVPGCQTGVSKMTIALIMQQPIDHNGYFLSTDDMADGSDCFATGFPSSDDRYYAYSNFASNLNGRTIPDVNGPWGPPQENTGDKCLLILKMDGGITPSFLRNMYPVPGTGTGTCSTVTARRFRLGSLRTASGASFANALDGAVWAALGLPDQSSDIDLALKGIARAKFDDLVFYDD